MNIVKKSHSLELDKMIRSGHFWIIIATIAAIAIIYYEWKDWFPWYWYFFIYEFKYDIVGSLFLIPFLYASLVFWWRGSFIALSLSAATITPILMYYSPNLESLLRNVAFLFFPLAIVIIITLELNWREKQNQIMAEREQERQIYMSEIFQAQEDERRRIAQELHDDTTQELLVVANHAHTLVSNWPSQNKDGMKEEAKWIRDAILQVSENVRRLSLDLRPSILDNLGLVAAVRWLADRLIQESEIDTRVVVKGAVRKLRTEDEVIIFRIIQEALNNIRRHSQATEAVITLKFAPEESLRITMRDNGNGFSLSEMFGNLTAEGKLGIIGMQQRAKFLKGTFDVQSQPGSGTLVSIEIAAQTLTRQD